MDEIKKAFQKVKEDIKGLTDSIKEIHNHIIFLHNEISTIKNQINILKQELIDKLSVENTPAHPVLNSANTIKDQTDPAHNLALKDLKDENISISIGNQGVPADRQTDRQTDTSTKFIDKNQNPTHIKEVSNILNSLDNIRKNLRRQFKQLSDQEFLIFSTIYQLEESKEHQLIDYSLLATTLNLTESSIRDYIVRLLKKGIAIEKTKINNKKISLSISQNLKKIANLSTIMSLRDL